MVDVPAQDVPGPAAQSFSPARETPKHFSSPAAAAFVASPATAVVTADMRIILLEIVDMSSFLLDRWVFTCTLGRVVPTLAAWLILKLLTRPCIAVL